MNKAIFLDRDGVLAAEKYKIEHPSNIEIFDYAHSCVKKIKSRGYLTIVVTNQSGVSRGLFSEDELQRANERLMEYTGVDAVYYCPHYERGVIEKYAKKCQCRKPCTGMIDRACREYDIERSASWMVGDRGVDIKAGIDAGLKTVMLESGYGSEDLQIGVTPDYIFDDLREFAKLIDNMS